MKSKYKKSKYNKRYKRGFSRKSRFSVRYRKTNPSPSDQFWKGLRPVIKREITKASETHFADYPVNAFTVPLWSQSNLTSSNRNVVDFMALFFQNVVLGPDVL